MSAVYVRPEGLQANVSGAVLLDGDATHAEHVARILSQLFVEVLWVGGEPPEGVRDLPVLWVPDPENLAGPPCALRGLIAAFETATAERVLVVAAADLPHFTPDLALALTAWPEHEVVVPVTSSGPQPQCALYARAPALARARAHYARGAYSLEELVDALDAGTVSGNDLNALTDPA